ncbi:PAN/Apple domain [Trinorchestia longiramus]|nr:PAN/Apple domain [Trinorchestia longiramus]
MKLLLLQLFAAALVSSAAAYQMVIKDTAIHSPISMRINVMTECECRAKCDMDSSCKAASYDAIADLCFMTDGGPDTVITQPLVDSVAFFKFQYVETPLEVFMAGATKNGSVARLRELCAEENGIHLIIKTEQVKAAAIQLVKDKGHLVVTTNVAWLPVRGCDGDKSLCHWPDGTRVTNGVFTEQEFDAYPLEPRTASVLGESRAKYDMDSSCKTASYDAIADHCFMTDGGPDTVITQPLVGSVAFFKFWEWNLSVLFCW